MEIILVGVVTLAVVQCVAVGYWLHLCFIPSEPVGYDPMWSRS